MKVACVKGARGQDSKEVAGPTRLPATRNREGMTHKPSATIGDQVKNTLRRLESPYKKDIRSGSATAGSNLNRGWREAADAREGVARKGGCLVAKTMPAGSHDVNGKSNTGKPRRGRLEGGGWQNNV